MTLEAKIGELSQYQSEVVALRNEIAKLQVQVQTDCAIITAHRDMRVWRAMKSDMSCAFSVCTIYSLDGPALPELKCLSSASQDVIQRA